MTVTVPLSRGMVAIIDMADARRVRAFKWYASQGGAAWYAQRMVRVGERQVALAMHRFILDAPAGTLVDHVNGDGLDNRRENLRLCTHAENLRNQGKRKGCTSKFKGVRLSNARWRAEIEKDGVHHSLGTYDNEVVAARVYDRAAVRMFGQFARTNVTLGLLPPLPISDEGLASLIAAQSASLPKQGFNMNMRAKFSVESVTRFNGGEKLTMRAVGRKDAYPADGSDEDNTYAKFSPSGDLTLTVANPALLGQFNPGDKFYLDFTKADA